MKNIRKKLSLASCTLLSGAPQAANAIDNAWDLDSSYLYYSEADDRVTVNKAIMKLSGDITDDDRATATLVFDTMSGSTPSGTVRSKTSAINSITNASGASTNISGSTAPDKVEFRDTRLGFSFDWDHNQSRLLKVKYGGNISVENDYQSFGASASISKDNESRSLTYTAGIAGYFDKIFRKTGGTPEPLSNVEDDSSFSDGERVTYELLGGVTKVLNRKTLGQLNYSFSYADGYLTDPYKVISQVELVTDSQTNSFAFSELERYYEGRPSKRLRNSIYSALVHQYGSNNQVIHASYRLYWDDWDVVSHTLELRHRNPLGNGQYIEPHVRYYTQTAANFFVHHLNNGEPLPQYASADYRLDAMKGMTIGIQYGRPMGGGKFRARVEYINQQFDQAEYNENLAYVFQISYQKQF